MNLTKSNLQGLVRLLDEPDTSAAEKLIGHLDYLDGEALESLDSLSREHGGFVRKHVLEILRRARVSNLDLRWDKLVNMRRLDLEDALLTIARAELSEEEVDGASVTEQLDEMADAVHGLLGHDESTELGVEVLSDILYDQYGLHGNRDNYYAVANSLLPTVLQRGSGIPISLCSIAILVGKRLGLPIYGIGTPGHFLGYFGDPTQLDGTYFDPFHGFSALPDEYVEELRESLPPHLLSPVNNREIAARTLRNLIAAHTRLEEAAPAARFKRWLDRL